MSAQVNIINDVGTLLRLPTKVTTELTDKACICISSAINEAATKNKIMKRLDDLTISNKA